MKRIAGQSRPKVRQDGVNTRAGLLIAAGEIFAELGFDRATAKEIATRAQTNAAAVNYYFGGIQALYEEVLVEAHRRIVNYNDLSQALAGSLNAEDKLRRLFKLMVAAIRADTREAWPIKIIVRELIAPTLHIARLRQEELDPKKALVMGVVAEITGAALDDPLVAHAAFSVMAPCFMLMVAGPRLSEIVPALGHQTTSDDILVDRLVRFALGGLTELAKRDGNEDLYVSEVSLSSMPHGR